jgi:hypothetical protein
VRVRTVTCTTAPHSFFFFQGDCSVPLHLQKLKYSHLPYSDISYRAIGNLLALPANNNGEPWETDSERVSAIFIFIFSKNRSHLEHDQANFMRLNITTLPVVQVIIKISVTRSKLEVVDEQGIVHQVQGVEYIKISL